MTKSTKAFEKKPFNWLATIRINLFILKLVGLWPAGDETYKLTFYTFYAVVTTVIIMGGYNIFQLMNVIANSSNIEMLIPMSLITSTNVLVSVKIYFFVRNLKVVKQLMVCLRTEQFHPRSPEQEAISQASLKFWYRAYYIYFALVSENVLLWLLSPILENRIQDKMLPFPTTVPFDSSKSPNYELLYIYQFVCVWYLIIANIHIDTITFALIMLTWSQCDILCDDLKNLDSNFEEKLIGCIKHHEEILWFAQCVNDSTSMIILAQFATSTAVLALVMYQLALVNPLSSAAVNYLSYIFGLTLQLFQYCWYGNQLTFKSSQLSYAVYQSAWFNQSTTVNRSISILHLRCQHPIKITAIGLFALSLDTFMNIMRSSWSYFTVLYQVNNS